MGLNEAMVKPWSGCRSVRFFGLSILLAVLVFTTQVSASTDNVGTVIVEDIHSPFADSFEKQPYIYVMLRSRDGEWSFKNTTTIGGSVHFEVPSGEQFYILILNRRLRRLYVFTNMGNYYTVDDGETLRISVKLEIFKAEVWRLMRIGNLDFRRAIEELNESRYDASTLYNLYGSIEEKAYLSLESAERGDYDEALMLLGELEGTVKDLRDNYKLLIVGINVSFILLYVMVLISSILIGRFFTGKKRYLIELVAFTALATLLLQYQPDFNFFMRKIVPEEFSSQWFQLGAVILLSVFLAVRVVIRLLSIAYPFASRTLEITVERLKKRKLRTLLTIITILIVVMSLTTLTSASLNLGAVEVVGMRRYVDHDLSAVIVKQGTEKTLSDPLIKRYAYVETAVALAYNPTIEVDERGIHRRFRAVNVNDPNRTMFLEGIVGLDIDPAVKLYNLTGILKEGSFMTRDGEAMISDSLAEALNVTVGDLIDICHGAENYYPGWVDDAVNLTRYKVTGVFSAEKAGAIKELNGYPLFNLMSIGRNFIITTVKGVLESSYGSSKGEIVSFTIVLKPGYDASSVASSLVSQGYTAWRIEDGVACFLVKSAAISISGMECHIVTIAIGSLLVFNVMLTSIYERRREIFTFTVVGINPSHIKNMILLEALTVVIIGGLTGYLLGGFMLEGLKALPITGSMLQEVSYVRSGPIYPALSLITIIFMALIGGYLPARKAMTITTPSLALRWSLEAEPLDEKTYKVNIPILLTPRELRAFPEYALRSSVYGSNMVLKLRRYVRSKDGAYKFIYDGSSPDSGGYGCRVNLSFIREGRGWKPLIILEEARSYPARYRRSVIDVLRMFFLEYSEWRAKRMKLPWRVKPTTRED